MFIDYEKLDARVAELKDELIADIRAWVAVPSVQAEPLEGKPFGAENARMLDLALETARGAAYETVKASFSLGKWQEAWKRVLTRRFQELERL